jgi:molecular chaperone DnaK (HSP70)
MMHNVKLLKKWCGLVMRIINEPTAALAYGLDKKERSKKSLFTI